MKNKIDILQIRKQMQDSIMTDLIIEFNYDPTYEKEDQINISLSIETKYGIKESVKKYRFLDVKKYYINNEGKKPPIYIEQVKFFQDDQNLYYLSVDPYEEKEVVDEKDNFVFYFKNIEIL